MELRCSQQQSEAAQCSAGTCMHVPCLEGVGRGLRAPCFIIGNSASLEGDKGVGVRSCSQGTVRVTCLLRMCAAPGNERLSLSLLSAVTRSGVAAFLHLVF